MIKTIPTVRASPLLLSIQIIVLRNYCVILFWPSGQCTLFTVFKYNFSTYFNRETKRDLTSRAILSCPLSLRFNRLWALCPCKVQEEDHHKQAPLKSSRNCVSPGKASICFIDVCNLTSSGPWSRWIGVDWAPHPGFPRAVRGSVATLKHVRVFPSRSRAITLSATIRYLAWGNRHVIAG